MITLRTPLQLNMRGGFGTTTDAGQIIEQRILDILITNFGERVMRPTHGADMGGFLFTQMRDDLLALKAQDIKTLLSMSVGVGEILSVEVRPLDGSDSSVRVAVEYRVEPGTAPRTAFNTISGLVTEETLFRDTHSI